MKKLISLLCTLCAFSLAAFAAEAEKPAPEPTSTPSVAQQLETAKADLAKAQAEIAGLKSIAQAVREQRDQNGRLYQDVQIDLLLAQQKIAALQQQLAAANAKPAPPEKSADGKPAEKSAP